MHSHRCTKRVSTFIVVLTALLFAKVPAWAQGTNDEPAYLNRSRLGSVWRTWCPA
jgi:hypothetical protein